MADLLSGITVDPAVCQGQSCIKGTRVMVSLILELLEAGVLPEQIIEEYYPQLTMQDVKACLRQGAT